MNSYPQPPSGNPSDVVLPVALREGTRSCATCHTIQNFVSYNHLSPIFRVFVTKISLENIPKHVSEASDH